MQRSVDSANVLLNNIECLPSQINRYIKDESIPMYSEKIIQRIDKLETHIHEDEPVDCPICTDSIDKGMIVTTTPCGHKLHHHCTVKLTLSLSNSIPCPVCRRNIIELSEDEKVDNLILFKPNQFIVEIHLRLAQLLNSLNNLSQTKQKYQSIPFIANK